MQNKYIGNFDILKIIAATCIMCHHYQQLTSVTFRGGIDFYGGNFFFGYLVELFFLMSGVLTEHTWKQNSLLGRWMLGKAKRIYPSAAIACTVCVLNAVIYDSLFHSALLSIDYSIANVMKSLLLINAGWAWDGGMGINNPTWYLCVLIICYLLYWCIKKITSLHRFLDRWGFGIVAAGCALLYFAVSRQWLHMPFLYMSNCRGYASFFAGVFLYHIVKDAPKKMIFIVNFILWSASIKVMTVEMSNWYVLTYLFFPAIVMTALLLGQVKLVVVKAAGAISFEVYLWHVPIYGLLTTILKVSGLSINHTYLTMIGFCICVWIWAAGMYFVIEKPLSRCLAQKKIINPQKSILEKMIL